MQIIFQFFAPQFSIHTLDLSRNLAENTPLIFFVGKTFAWFTSSDEVTNRLSAKGDFGNTIYEQDFTPPENWTPGQTVEKKAGVVNTGNISSLVSITPTAKIDITYNEAAAAVAAPTTTDYVALADGSGANERISMQAGGQLAFVSDSTDGTKLAAVTKDSLTVSGKAKANATATDPVATYDTTEAVLNVSADDFIPSTTGYYIFKRNEGGTVKYSGYYAVVDSGVTYYALETATESNGNASGSTVKTTPFIKGTVAAGESPKFVKQTTKTQQDVLLALDSTSAPTKITGKYTVTSGNDLKFTINLANVGTGADNWTNLSGSTTAAANGAGTFYYNNDLDPGASTSNVIASVKLDDDNTASFVSFNFDLNLAMNSVQVGMLTDGTETIPGNTSIGKGEALSVKATDVHDAGDTEIKSVTWSLS